MDKFTFEELKKISDIQEELIDSLIEKIARYEGAMSAISDYYTGFTLGKIVWTAGVFKKMQEDSDFRHFVTKSMQRYMMGDWGEMDPEDKELNDSSLSGGGRIFAAYENAAYRIWIITEWDRSVTTILFPEEY